MVLWQLTAYALGAHGVVNAVTSLKDSAVVVGLIVGEPRALWTLLNRFESCNAYFGSLESY